MIPALCSQMAQECDASRQCGTVPPLPNRYVDASRNTAVWGDKRNDMKSGD